VKGSWWRERDKVEWAQLLLASFEHWTGRALITAKDGDEELAASLFVAPFVVVSHGTEADPILNYGNQVALRLWEMEWLEFCRTPSRLTAEPVNRAERERMLSEAAARGYCSDYRGVRISKAGRRFLVENAIVWNVVDGNGRQCGQAATFSKWTFI
jgi:hypothetical protein